MAFTRLDQPPDLADQSEMCETIWSVFSGPTIYRPRSPWGPIEDLCGAFAIFFSLCAFMDCRFMARFKGGAFMGSWLDVLTGPSVYRANTPWSPAAAIVAVALIVSVQLTLPLVVYGLSPELYQVISGETDQPKIWPQSGSPTLGLLQQIVAGCLVWFAAGLGSGTRRAVLSLPPLKGGAYTYVALALLVFSIMVPVKLLSQNFPSLLHSLMGRILSITGSNPTWPWMNVPVVLIATPLVEEFMFRGFLLSALAKSKIGFWGAAIFTDAAWTALHASYQPWNALPAIFVFGLLVSFLLWRTGNLWTCIFAHMTVNAEALLTQVILGLVLG